MKPKFLLSAFLLFLSVAAFAQEATTIVEDKLSPDINVTYHVLSTDRKVLQGQYQAFFKKGKVAIASGAYDHNKKTGTWHFFNKTGKLMQHYDYNRHTLTYEAPEDSTKSFKYVLDEDFTAKDTVTKPIRIGGRYYGYIPYINLFRLPKELYDFAYAGSYTPSAYIELLVSPAGRLADYRVHISSPIYGEKVLAVNINQLSDEDKTFYPATLNGREISSRIIIICSLNGPRLVL